MIILLLLGLSGLLRGGGFLFFGEILGHFLFQLIPYHYVAYNMGQHGYEPCNRIGQVDSDYLVVLGDLEYRGYP